MHYLPMIFLFSILNFYRNDYKVKKANSHYRQIGNCRKKRVWLTLFEILLWVQQCFSVFFFFFYLYHTLLRQILFSILKWGNKIVLYLANNYEISEWKRCHYTSNLWDHALFTTNIAESSSLTFLIFWISWPEGLKLKIYQLCTRILLFC